MCYNSSVLVIFLILKVIILLVLPIVAYALYRKKNNLFDIVGIINIAFILFLILMRLFGNECITDRKTDRTGQDHYGQLPESRPVVFFGMQGLLFLFLFFA